MFFSIHEKEIREITLDQLEEHDICVGYLTLDELRKCYKELGLSEVAVKDCMTDFTHFRTSIDVYDEFSFGMINIVDILNLSSRRNRIGFFIKKNLFIVVKIIDKGDSIRQMFLDAIGRFRQNATMEKGDIRRSGTPSFQWKQGTCHDRTPDHCHGAGGRRRKDGQRTEYRDF